MSESVVDALAAVMAELPSIGKGDKSPEGYVYRGIEAITKHLQPLLAKHRIVIVPRATVTSVVPSPAMKDGWQDVHMEVEWAVYGPAGEPLIARTNGIGRDRSDKGANKAQTQAYKYLLLHLLCISDAKDDADGHTYEKDRALPPVEATDDQFNSIEAWIAEHDDATNDLLRDWWKKARIPRLERLTVDQADRVLKHMAELDRAATNTGVGSLPLGDEK